MIDPVQLETYTRELCSALRSLGTQLANIQLPLACPGDGQARVIYADPSHEAYRARESALANLSKLQLMLFSPGDFLQQLALQVVIRIVSLSGPSTDCTSPRRSS
jgi:hypothetical protein